MSVLLYISERVSIPHTPFSAALSSETTKLPPLAATVESRDLDGISKYRHH